MLHTAQNVCRLIPMLRKLDILKYKQPNNRNVRCGLYLINKVYITNNKRISDKPTNKERISNATTQMKELFVTKQLKGRVPATQRKW